MVAVNLGWIDLENPSISYFEEAGERIPKLNWGTTITIEASGCGTSNSGDSRYCEYSYNPNVHDDACAIHGYSSAFKLSDFDTCVEPAPSFNYSVAFNFKCSIQRS